MPLGQPPQLARAPRRVDEVRGRVDKVSCALLDLGSNKIPKYRGRVREDREAGYGLDLSPFGGVLAAQKLLYRIGHLVG